MKKVYVFFANGFEEIEGLTVVDILRRAGVETVMVSIHEDLMVTGAHQIAVRADVRFTEVDFLDADMLVLPGGMPGTRYLGAHEGLKELLLKADKEKKGLAAICAAPSVLGDLGLLQGKTAVCYPGFEERLRGAVIGTHTFETDGHITTSRGMGTAIDFALELTRRLCGEEQAKTLGNGIIYLAN